MLDQSRLDALLNEYKGNLFEFLFANFLARNTNQESEFLSSLSSEVHTMLTQQESMLRNYYPELLIELPRLAEMAVIDFLKKYKISKAKSVELVGKINNSQVKENSEADIVLKTANETYPLSIKISKNHAFVNTKSAGPKTFFSKYFSRFNSQEYQEEFNQYYENEYEKMAMQMHYDKGLTFNGSFKDWELNGYPVLPGKLNEDEKIPLLNFYKKINEKINKQLTEYKNKDESLFLECLSPLTGFSSNDIIQITAFHTIKDQKFVNKKIHISGHDLNQKISEFHLKKSTLDINLGNLILQLRLKPMNKFTSKAFKINCAIKFLN